MQAEPDAQAPSPPRPPAVPSARLQEAVRVPWPDPDTEYPSDEALRDRFPPGHAYARFFLRDDDVSYEGIGICVGTADAFEDATDAPRYAYEVYAGQEDPRWSTHHTFAVRRCESRLINRAARYLQRVVHVDQGRPRVGDARHPDRVQDARDAGAADEHVVAASDLEDPASAHLRGRVVDSALCLEFLRHGRRW